MIDKKQKKQRYIPRPLSLEMLLGIIALIAILVMIWTLVSITDHIPVMMIAGTIFTVCVVFIIFLLMDPDSVRARQTDAMLRLSSKMVDLMANGMSLAAAQSICELLLPSTAAIAVAITDKKLILGYAGYMEAENPQGAAIRTHATHEAIADGMPRVIYTADEIGFPSEATIIKAAIIVPLKVSGEIRGTLKFYYRSGKKITETQKSIAQGFAALLSTQMAASELEEQRELATSMELKMLQNQINPHFLFNTINTIASLIRTDPMKARTLLRDFAVFYRSTLENSQDRIELARELEQTQRYFSFEEARFGEDRLELLVELNGRERSLHDQHDQPMTKDANGDVLPSVQRAPFDASEMLVPPFLLQPLVENAVKHAMPASGKLTISIYSLAEGDDVLICVEDDGVGMDESTRLNIMEARSETGLGIAVKNVHDRMHGFYGPDAEMIVESKLGEGTKITLRFPGCAK